ncbi:hypothetical protein ACO0QE_004469 [Hanseniaspora vineae]
MRFKKNIYKFVKIKKDWKLLLLLAALTVVEGAVPCLVSVLVGRTFGVLSKAAQGKYLTKHAMFHDLTIRCMSIMCCAAGSFPICWININNWMQFGERQGLRIRNSILKKYLNLPMEWFNVQEDLMATFTQTNRCVEELRSSAAEASGITLQNLVTCCGLIGVSFYYSWSLTLIFLCSSPLIIASSIVCSLKYEKFLNLENNESKLASNTLLWCMENIRIVKGFQTEPLEAANFKQRAENCNRYFVKAATYIATNESIIRILSLIMFVQGFWFGNHQIKKGKLNTTQVMVCFSCCITLAATLMSTLQQILLMQRGKIALAYIDNLYDPSHNSSTALSSKSTKETLKPLNNPSFSAYEIELSNVSFNYLSRPKDNVVSNVSMKFETNKTTFLIGKSGSGKSTVANILLKLYDNYQGDIKINGLNIKNINDNWIYSNVLLIEQNCTLFDDSLRNNILLGSNAIKNMNAAQVEQILIDACEKALLSDFIASLPNGLDTWIGKSNNNGIQLSGGQQQKVAIARAIVSGKAVWIMDEALSALDAGQKDAIMKILKCIRKNQTTIVLTHDLTHIAENDYVYYMETGEIKEHGMQKILLSNETSIFRKMYKLQQIRKIHAEDKQSLLNDRDNKSPQEEDKTVLRTTQEERVTLKEEECNTKIWTKIQQKLLESPSSEKVDAQVDVESEKNTASVCTTTSDLESLPTDDDNSRIPLMPLKALTQNMLATIQQKTLLFIGLLCAVLAGASNPIFSWTFAKLLNQSVPDKNNKAQPNSYIIKWSMIVLAISIVDGVLTLGKSFLLKYVAEYWIYDLRLLCFSKIANQDVSWFQEALNKPSEVAALMMNDLRDLRSLVSEFTSAVTTLLFVSLIGLIWALITGWKLSLVCLSLIPFYLIFTGIYGALLQKAENNYKSKIADLENKQYEVVSNIKSIRLLQLESHFLLQMDKLINKLQKAITFRTCATGLGVAIFKTITYSVQAILLYYGLKLVCDGEYTAEKMFETFTLLLFTVATCSSLSNSIPEMARGQRAASYVFKVIQSSVQSTPFQESQIDNMIPKQDNFESSSSTVIKFTNFCFSYPSMPNVTIFKNLSFNIEKNEIIGIVGKSGSGKSTIASLLMLLYPVYQVKALNIKGCDINDFGVSTIRRMISIVEQKPSFFKSTIRENLLYGSTAHSNNEKVLWELLEKLELKSFVNALPDKLDTVVDSSLVSGGQAQRLSLIRSLMRKAEIMVFDECTSALDATNADIIENFVTSRTESRLKETTRVIITHSKTMMKKCDRLIVLGGTDGAVVESGTYAELAAEKTSYFNQVLMENA